MDAKVEELHLRAESLFAKFNQGGGRNYIDEAIAVDRKALELCPPDHPKRDLSLTRISIHLWNRYSQSGSMKDLEDAIMLNQEALELRPLGHPDRSVSLSNLAVNFSTRYDQLGEVEDLSKALNLHREALELFPEHHPDRIMRFHGLANCLYTRYQQLGTMENLTEVIVLDRKALALCPVGHPDRTPSLNNLATRLSARYGCLGEMEDLNEAIILNQEALALHPVGYSDQSMSLNNLANCLYTRYNQLGTIEDLTEAIVLDREALALRPVGHPNRSSSLNNLAICLSTRYGRLGAMEDLNEAVALNREALALCPVGHSNRSSSLNNLAVRLSIRYSRLGEMEDLNEALVLDREALALRPVGHPNRPSSLNNLAVRLSIRYNRLGKVEDLNKALILDREALALRPVGHPSRSSSLNNLAIRLSTRYSHLREMEDLNEAIVLGRDALALRPPGHPYRSRSLETLADHLRTRFIQSSHLEDKAEIFSLYANLAYVSQMVSSSDLCAARAWIRTAEHFQHPTTLLAYETSLRLLVHHLATLPSLPQHLTVFKAHTSSLAVDAFSACLRNQSLTKAVELLEQGRGVFWTQLTRLRSPLDDVIGSGPAGKTLADKFTQLTLLIRKAQDSPSEDQHDRVCHFNFQLESVVTDIRKLPGLSHFLLPSLFSDLQQAAREGPVIIVNASQYSCDALVVLVDQDPIHIPLSITKEDVQELASKFRTITVRAKSVDMTRDLCIALREIWDKVVSLIVDFIQTIRPRQSRIWWCPTAEFSPLPLHASGPYRKGQQNLADLYISSYTPTLAALIRARRHSQSHFPSKVKQFVAIGQAQAIGGNELVSVGDELTNVSQRVHGLATFTRIEGPESCIGRVTKELCKNDWVHFACHGLPNPAEPFESAFALHDGSFTIQRIIQCDLENPEFAYLSACHTTVGDEESPDEVIHLASAMQFAGFRSVIGTMWAVDDSETNKIVSVFYDNMKDESGRLDYTRAAFALNKSMKEVLDVPFDQRILYIHLGA